MKTQTGSKITIRDLNGFQQEIDDLDTALETAAEYMDWHHENPAYTEFDKKQQAYWVDIHQKLTAIKNKSRNENRKKAKYS